MAHPKTQPSEIEQLRREVMILHQENVALKQEKADLELLIETNIAHSDFVEDELFHDIESTRESLRSEIEKLRQEEAKLKRENTDLELLINMTIEHSDFIEEELLQSIQKLEAVKKRLLLEITKLRREIEGLSQKIAELRREKADLEAVMELNIEHSDFIEEGLLHKVESTLRESERRFRLISETIPVPIIVTLVSDSTIVYANEPASMLFGISLKTLQGHKSIDFYDPADRNPVSEEALATQGYMSDYELKVRRSDGTRRWVRLSARFLTFNDQPCLLNALYDMTERRQAEEQIRSLNDELEHRVEERTIELRSANLALQQSLDQLKITQDQLIQAEKAVALTGLVAGVAHEINNPVGIGVTSASYLEQKTREIKDLYDQGVMKRSDLENYMKTAQESTVMILRNLQRAADLVRSFKQVAVDQTSSEKRRFKLKAYIDDLLISLRPKLRKTNHAITVHCSENLEITSYPGAFSQLITNLVINSLIHGFEHKGEGKIVLDVTCEINILHMQYSDNGKGMTEKERSRIFEAFYTTKRGQGGTGLGLHIVYNLVTRQLGGSIECESIPEVGTTFVIQIPLM